MCDALKARLRAREMDLVLMKDHDDMCTDMEEQLKRVNLSSNEDCLEIFKEEVYKLEVGISFCDDSYRRNQSRFVTWSYSLSWRREQRIKWFLHVMYNVYARASHICVKYSAHIYSRWDESANYNMVSSAPK